MSGAALQLHAALHHDFPVIVLARERAGGSHFDGDEAAAGEHALVHLLPSRTIMRLHHTPLSCNDTEIIPRGDESRKPSRATGTTGLYSRRHSDGARLERGLEGSFTALFRTDRVTVGDWSSCTM